MKFIAHVLTSVGLLLLPYVAAAQLGEIDTFVSRLSGFINNILIPFVFGLALLLFIWGMYRWFIQGGANETDREKGKQLTLYAIIAFVLMVSIWAIVNLLAVGLFGEDRDIRQDQLPSGVTIGGEADASFPGGGSNPPPGYNFDKGGPQ